MNAEFSIFDFDFSFQCECCISEFLLFFTSRFLVFIERFHFWLRHLLSIQNVKMRVESTRNAIKYVALPVLELMCA